MNPYFIGFVLPFVASLLLTKRKSEKKKRGLPADVGGEPGYAIRNHRFQQPVETHWEGIYTLAELFEQSCKQFAYMPLLGTRKLISREMEVAADGRSFEKLHLGQYEWKNYADVFKTICDFSSGLVQIGHQKDECVAIFSDTRAEWQIALQTEVTTVVCGRKELKKLIDISGQLDTVKHVIYIDEEGVSTEVSLAAKCTSWTVKSFEDVERIGQERPMEANLPLPSDTAVIMYTSGNTGMPKGVMMSHRNVLATVSAVMTIVPALGRKDVYLAYLPLAHILELAAEAVITAVGASIGYGSPLTLTDTSNKIKKGTKGDASALKPTLMTAVPAILDRVHDGVDAKGGVAKKLFDIAYSRRLAAVNGSWLGAWGLEKILWDMLVFRKVRAILGGRIRFILSGGAPLSGDTQRFINICLGAPISQGYGLTETCAGGTFSEYDDSSVGRVGAPLPCSYIKDDERGMRWFYSGDIGRLHPDGCLEIIDRKKDIVKLQHGEYVSLGKVEASLSSSPYVDNIMIHADPFHSYCVALVVAAQSELKYWASKQGITYTDFSDLCQKQETVKEVLQSLAKAAKQVRLEKFEIPAKIKLIPEPWTPESGLVTAALKLKREIIKKAYGTELAQLYS
ncbi:hypothetical protein PR202_gb16695 [Eleusine coracana subsp. coracana]|uniref:AMP-dependent synthetase/ligase domain-containing protein n=1 Tax=Eleusine coracana subsp. coracana TaxID=191504 RepID=A0AAV5F264_ELECO|nr:hypothetical protein PR202_gb16695 [Eleusine coracana subsp. coracana]